MRNDSFLSKLIQGAGFTSTIAGLITQYFLRSNFQNLLRITDDNSFSAFSFSSMVIGIVSIVGLFAYRHNLSSKKYFWGYQKYLKYIRNPNTVDFVPEPFYLDGKRLGSISLILSFMSFVGVIILQNHFYRNVAYSLFIILLILSVSIFLLSMYVLVEWKEDTKSRKERLKERIQDFFTPPFKELSRHEDTSNFLYPAPRQTVEVKGEKYSIVTDMNDPDKYFSVEPFVEPPTPKRAVGTQVSKK